jgi:fructuronate reductase
MRHQGLDDLHVIGAIKEVRVAFVDPEGLVARMAHAETKIVSLTITEKGYCHDPATGLLQRDHPDILVDLHQPAAPRSALGFILAALARRRALGLPPFTLLSCDNLPGNGRLLKNVLVGLAQQHNPDLAAFITQEVVCPSTMVDRIVPATTDADRTRIAARLGCSDAWPVVTEPFSQWVIEDNFPLGRPDWSIAGAQFTRDVAPYETMKLRLLNGAHSCLAYIGLLLGYETVAAAMQDASLAAFIAGFITEVTHVLQPPPGVDLVAYQSALRQRFCNPMLAHRTQQIAMDGSQKIPQRWLASVAACLRAAKPFPHLTFAVAAWMRYTLGTNEKGMALALQDPLAATLAACAARAGFNADPLTHALLDVHAIFPRDLAQNPNFVTPVRTALDGILKFGAGEMLQRIVASAQGAP